MPDDDDKTTPVICKCGRPRCTSADLRRWNAERPCTRDPRPDPAWAAAICWFNGPPESCIRKHIDKEIKIP